MHGSHVAVRTVCDEQWALNFTSSTRVLGHVLSMNMGMQFVGLRFLVPMLMGFRPLRTVLLLSLIMAFVSWSCFATVTDVSQMLWLSPHSRERSVLTIVRTGVSNTFGAQTYRDSLAAVGVLEQIASTVGN